MSLLNRVGDLVRRSFHKQPKQVFFNKLNKIQSIQRLKFSSIPPDKSFRLANVDDLQAADKGGERTNRGISTIQFQQTSEIFPRDKRSQIVIDLSHEQGYRRGHIKGALNLPIEKFDFCRLVDTYGGIQQEEIVEVFRGLGVTNSTSEIILYDNSGLLACRLWFVMRYFGFRNVRILNGGWRAWLAEGNPVHEKIVTPQKAAKLDLKPKRTSLVTKPTQMIFDHEQKKEHSYYIDTRRPEAYAGYHIPRAINIPSQRFMQDGQFVSVKEIREILKQKNIDTTKADSSIILYSSKSLTSTVGYFALSMAGIDRVSVYDGGIYNWVSNFENKLSADAIDHLGK